MAVPGNMSVGNLTNTTSSDALQSALDLSDKLSVAIDVVLIVLGVVFNLFLLVVVLGKKELRCDIRNMLIANVAVADLIGSCVILPVDVSLTLRGDWDLGCYPHIVFQLLDLFCSGFVSMWGLVCLDSVLLARVCHLEMPLTSLLTSAVSPSNLVWKRRLDRAVVVVVMALPWVLCATVITPIIFAGLHELRRQLWTDQRCEFIFDPWVPLALNILFFFLPCLIVLVLLSVIACVLCYRRRRGGFGAVTPTGTPPYTPTTSASSLGETSCAGRMDRPLAYAVATVLTVVLMVPRHVLSMVDHYHGLPELTDVPNWVLVISTIQLVVQAAPVCLPLVWLLLLPEVRARAWHLLTLGRRVVTRVKDAPHFDPSVSYRNLDP
ncbi:beta-3 adrenergic receptor-like [Babylonia areolata]|uniref:beta-3 adrenergic receptor-like n=1 Tax=Babylonia areolata TaxID=304850 RepID=UPI003FD02875